MQRHRRDWDDHVSYQFMPLTVKTNLQIYFLRLIMVLLIWFAGWALREFADSVFYVVYLARNSSSYNHQFYCCRITRGNVSFHLRQYHFCLQTSVMNVFFSMYCSIIWNKLINSPPRENLEGNVGKKKAYGFDVWVMCSSSCKTIGLYNCIS